MDIHKSHSRNDLIDLINTLNIPIIFSHCDNKKDLLNKFQDFFDSDKDVDLKNDNVYKLKNKRDIQIFLKNQNIKKTLTMKEKNAVMSICKNIIQYCTNGYMIENSIFYKDEQTIHDDMLYVLQFGDIPSVRRSVKLMNRNLKSKEIYKPIISPQMEKKISDKQISKHCVYSSLIVKTGEFILHFN